MRQIKFRQPLRNNDGSFKEWFYWGFIDDTFISPAMQLNAVDTRKESQEYTGLKDKNGKEIYEGDIIKWRTESGGVWDSEQVSVVKFEKGCFVALLALREMAHIEVIGNIYEHEHANLLATGKG